MAVRETRARIQGQAGRAFKDYKFDYLGDPYQVRLPVRNWGCGLRFRLS
jgi:hypothetical protein